ncbi:cysteine hydrolase family protein [Chloroflexota bacterium]
MTETLSIDQGKTAVLIMDYQNAPQLGNLTETVRNELLAKANAVLARAREKGIPIIYIEVRRGEKTTENAIHSAVAPKPGELVLTKQRVGPFTTTDLDAILKSKGIDTLVLMGISTSGVVLSTVRGAADLDYRIIVLSDCCTDRDEEVQRVLMGKVFQLFRQATVIESQEFIQAL